MARSKAHTVMRHKSEHRKKRGSERVGGGRRDDRSKGRGKKEERKKKGIREYGGGGGDHIEDDLRSCSKFIVCVFNIMMRCPDYFCYTQHD